MRIGKASYSSKIGSKGDVSIENGIDEAYIRDQLEGEKTPFSLSLINYGISESVARFEPYKATMDDFLKEDNVEDFLVETGYGIRFTESARILITHLLFGVQSLTKKGLVKRIPTDSAKVVFLGRKISSVKHPKFVFEVETEGNGANGLVRLSILLGNWLSKYREGYTLAPPERDFMEKLSVDKFVDIIVHPGLWLPGMTRRYFIHSHQKFKEIAKDTGSQHLLPNEIYLALEGEYRDWSDVLIESDPKFGYLAESGGYGGTGLPGLYRFHRNVFFHIYDWKGDITSRHELPSKLEKMPVTVIEAELNLLFPDFITQFYNLAKTYFQFYLYFEDCHPYI